ncbi:MAG: tRNA (guanosine(37)-N1)-methyltransferase TrmD [Actinomycetota bacterium]
MQIDIISIFPGAFSGFFEVGLLGKAITRGLVKIQVHDLRDWAPEPHRRLDDTPFGGGAGMVMTAPPIVEAVEAVLGQDTASILFCSAAGKQFTQQMASDLAARSRMIIVCGRYEGIDQRAIEILEAEEVCVGEYVLAGGESAGLVIVDAVTRLIPGVMGNPSSLNEESFGSGLLEYPQYTRPPRFRARDVPQVLTSGNHAEIAAWRHEQALSRTRQNRPDMLPDGELDCEPDGQPDGE